LSSDRTIDDRTDAAIEKGNARCLAAITVLYGGIVGGQTTAYGASKGAVRLLTKATAVQYAREGIRCNSVHPGVIETPMTARMLGSEAGRQQSLARHPLGRLGQPEDVAYGVLYLASDESAFVTGSELVIDGGLTAQ
jgi:cyclopentanol dehydrogenase